MWDAMFNDYATYLMVFVRISGMLLFNPLFSRRNLPVRFKMGLVLALTVLISPTLLGSNFVALSGSVMIFAALKEIFVGYCVGMVFSFFYYMIFFVGDVIDTQFGLSMAKVFDPGTNIQMSVTGNWFSIIFIVYIFLTDSHLLMIRIFASSFDIIPLGAASFNVSGSSEFMIELFLNIFMICIRMILPFVAVEFVMEVCMGVLMKLIPQIHVFVINIQLKLLMGLLMLLILITPITAFLNNYMDMMFKMMENVMFRFV